MFLSELTPGQRAVVRGLMAASPDIHASILRRLADIGFIAGESLQLLHRGPGGREPLAVQIGETMFALRLVEARCIRVELQ
ncbi:FeoA family protein [Rhodoferax mekongensis]|uniref:FeoA family protein n=1 Tax=Rhodoferax mekongensis TaxID=3068341 RepID=UPI0028BE6027|nr:FeoA family protein [Rhodoferax sp. TBRC 17199]MDT7515187.1 FeoA family protein [Rhodoferax sp. TBRC 17199]